MNSRFHSARYVIVGLPLLFLAVFYFYPLFAILDLSFRPEGAWNMQWLPRMLRTGYILRTLWFTTWQAAVSTILTLALALPGAYVLARFRFRGRKLIQALATVPFVLPTVVVAAAFNALLGTRGLANQMAMDLLGLPDPPIRLDQTVWLILLAHVFYNYTVVLRIVGGFWARLDPALTEAARMLGASPWQAFRRITLPVLRPALTAAGLLVYVFCFSSFGVIIILGGPRFATIEVEIFRQAVHLFNLPMAAGLSLLQILFMFLLMRVYTALQRNALSLTPTADVRARRPVTTAAEKALVAGTIILMAVLLGSPLVSLVIRSISSESGLSFVYYAKLFQNAADSVFFVPPVNAVVNSAGFAGVTLVLALLLGLPAAVFLAAPRTRLTGLLDPLFMLPLSTSAVTLGYGFIVALDEPPLDLRSSLLLVPIAHTLVAFPFVVRSLLPALQSIPRSLKEAAALLGASPGTVWRTVDFPIVWRAVLVGAVFAFTISLGEFGASVFVARPQTPTMPVAIYRFLGQPGAANYGQAMAMSSVLMVVTAAGIGILERLRVAGGEF